METSFVIIDGNYVLYRSFWGIRPLFTEDKQQVNAVYGFFSTLLKLLALPYIDHIAITFDKGKPEFRTQQMPEYKAHRPKMPDELFSQLEIIQEMLIESKFPTYFKEGYEADDLIATMSKIIVENGKENVLIFSGDMDLGQLLSDQIHMILYEKGSNKEPKIINAEAFTKKWHVAPNKVVDFKVLSGDPADNIVGVPGIGKIGAKKLLEEYGTLKGIYEHIEDIKGAMKQKLIDGKGDAEIAKQIITLVDDAPVDFHFNECSLQHIDMERLMELFDRFNFKSLRRRAEEIVRKRFTIEKDKLLVSKESKEAEKNGAGRSQSSQMSLF